MRVGGIRRTGDAHLVQPISPVERIPRERSVRREDPSQPPIGYVGWADGVLVSKSLAKALAELNGANGTNQTGEE